MPDQITKQRLDKIEEAVVELSRIFDSFEGNNKTYFRDRIDQILSRQPEPKTEKEVAPEVCEAEIEKLFLCIDRYNRAFNTKNWIIYSEAKNDIINFIKNLNKDIKPQEKPEEKWVPKIENLIFLMEQETDPEQKFVMREVVKRWQDILISVYKQILEK